MSNLLDIDVDELERFLRAEGVVAETPSKLATASRRAEDASEGIENQRFETRRRRHRSRRKLSSSSSSREDSSSSAEEEVSGRGREGRRHRYEHCRRRKHGTLKKWRGFYQPVDAEIFRRVTRSADQFRTRIDRGRFCR